MKPLRSKRIRRGRPTGAPGAGRARHAPGAGRLDTDRMERHLIQLHNTARPHGYNYLRCGAPYRDRQYWAMQKAKGNKPAYYKRRDTAPA
jgi:hypothetical protein